MRRPSPLDQKTNAMSSCKDLVKLLNCGSTAEQHRAVWAVARLSAQPEKRPKFVAAGAIPRLVQLLKSSSEKVQEAAALALEELAESDNDRFGVGAADGAIANLVYLMKSDSAAVRQQAVRTVGNISSDELNLNAIIAADALPALVKLLEPGSTPQMELSLCILDAGKYRT